MAGRDLPEFAPAASPGVHEQDARLRVEPGLEPRHSVEEAGIPTGLATVTNAYL